MTLTNGITVFDLPNMQLIIKALDVCEKENRNPENIRFIDDNKDEALMGGFKEAGNIMKMFDGDQFTCWTWFIDANEID